MPSFPARRAALAGALTLAALVAPSAASADVTAEVTRDDTLVVTSDDEGDFIRLFGSTSSPDIIRVASGPSAGELTFNRLTFDRIQVNAGGGDDHVQVDNEPVFTDTEPTTINAGEGNDFVNAGNGPETIIGDAGDDTLFGSGARDTIAGAAGQDRIGGQAGADIVAGGSGEDRFIHGNGDGPDTVNGGDDTDTIELLGGDDEDVINVSDQDGDLLLQVLKPINARIDAPGVERVQFEGAGGSDTVAGGAALPFVLDANGGPGFDRLGGFAGNDRISGGSGEDSVSGGRGDDTLNGDGDDDIVAGGEGADSLRGGSGADSFSCDPLDLLFDRESVDSADDCPVPAPPSLAPAPGDAGAGDAPAAPAQPVVPPGGVAAVATGELPGGALGFGKPRIALTRTGMKVVLRNTHAAPIRVAIAASEKRGRKVHRYRRATKTVAAGRRVTVTLKAPRALARQLKAKAAGRRRAVVTVTNPATGGKVTVRR